MSKEGMRAEVSASAASRRGTRPAQRHDEPGNHTAWIRRKTFSRAKIKVGLLQFDLWRALDFENEDAFLFHELIWACNFGLLAVQLELRIVSQAVD